MDDLITFFLQKPSHLLGSELVRADGNAVDKLHGAPQTVELHALVNVHDAVGGRRSAPHAVVQEAADARQDDLEHGKAAAKALFGQKVTLACNGNLLGERKRQKSKVTDEHVQEQSAASSNKVLFFAKITRTLKNFFFFFPLHGKVTNLPAGFPTSQLEAQGAEGHTWLLASSSSPPVVPPLHSTHKSEPGVTEPAHTLEASLYTATCDAVPLM